VHTTSDIDTLALSGNEPVEARARFQQRQDLGVVWLYADPDRPGTVAERQLDGAGPRWPRRSVGCCAGGAAAQHLDRVEIDRPLTTALSATTAPAFNDALHQLMQEADLSFRQVAENSGHRISRSTAHRMVTTEDVLPARAEQVYAFAEACGANETQCEFTAATGCHDLLARRARPGLCLFPAQELFQLRGGGDDRGLLRHCTDADIEANYTDTHGASVVGFAFTELLGFKLLPRLKNIGSVRLYSPDDGPDAWPKLERVIKNRPIDWELIERNYDQMVKYATALRLGTAEAEQVLRRFTKGGGPKTPSTSPWRNSGG
jgi:hypothetical protein